jgi:secondary thiamine-phosphate synthase enzyme
MNKARELEVETGKNREVVDITEAVQEFVTPEASAVNVFVAHTTCAVTAADLDPGTDEDLLDAVWQMIPKLKYRHPHNPAHVPAHLASSIIGPSVTVPAKNGKLILGTWQRIILVELDGPRTRHLVVTNL